MIHYFVRNGGEPCGRDENPAEWMLHVIGAAPGAHTETDWHAVWRGSDEYTAVQSELHSLESMSVTCMAPSSFKNDAPGEAGDNSSTATYAAPFRTQFWLVLKRVFQQYWRTPSYIYSKLVLCCGTVRQCHLCPLVELSSMY